LRYHSVKQKNKRIKFKPIRFVVEYNQAGVEIDHEGRIHSVRYVYLPLEN